MSRPRLQYGAHVFTDTPRQTVQANATPSPLSTPRLRRNQLMLHQPVPAIPPSATRSCRLRIILTSCCTFSSVNKCSGCCLRWEGGLVSDEGFGFGSAACSGSGSGWCRAEGPDQGGVQSPAVGLYRPPVDLHHRLRLEPRGGAVSTAAAAAAAAAAAEAAAATAAATARLDG